MRKGGGFSFPFVRSLLFSSFPSFASAVVARLTERTIQKLKKKNFRYGASLQGLTPLLSALVSSSPGVTVCNIDNGFGAAMAAARILRTAAKLRRVQKAATASAAAATAGGAVSA